MSMSAAKPGECRNGHLGMQTNCPACWDRYVQEILMATTTTNPPADENSDEVGRRAKELRDTLNEYVYTDGLGEPEAVKHCRAFLHWILERRKKNTCAAGPAAPAELDALRVLNNELRAQVERLEGERDGARFQLSEHKTRLESVQNRCGYLAAELAAMKEREDVIVHGDTEIIKNLTVERDAARAELAAVTSERDIYRAKYQTLAYETGR